MSTKPPTDPPLERGANPVRPATAPTPRRPAPPPPKSGFQRFVLQFLLLIIALGGAFGTGYLVNANEMQLDRNDLLQQQLDARERILALEKQIAELQERRESGNRVELDLTDVFEPIRDAVGRIALVRMGEISREITTELTRLVEDDLPANAVGTAAPGGMSGGSPVTGQASEPEAASATGETAPPPGPGGPDALQPSSAALDPAKAPDRPEAVELAGPAPAGADPPTDTPAPAASNSPAVNELPAADLGPPAPSEQEVSPAALLFEAPVPPSGGGSGIAKPASFAQREPTDVAELTGAPLPPGGVPSTEP